MKVRKSRTFFVLGIDAFAFGLFCAFFVYKICVLVRFFYMEFDLPHIRENVPLKNFTTWKIGGSARFFIEAKSAEVPKILSWANSKGIKTHILGAGSNVLIKDSGVDGLVVRLKDDVSSVKISEETVSAGAGVRLAQFVDCLAKNGVSGFEFLAGIPGTIGGSVFMNAGVGGSDRREVSDVFIGAQLCSRKGERFWVGPDFMEFSHRKSALQSSENVLIFASFKIEKKSCPDEILKKTRENIEARLKREPKNRRNAGSVFKACGGVPAGFLIDKAGLKGCRIGDAQISGVHANWIENLGCATSSDVEALINLAKEKVFEKFGARLEEEVRFLG